MLNASLHMASGILLGLGFFLTAHSNNLMMLWLSAGVLAGLADGRVTC